MRIQVICYASSAVEKGGITFSPLDAPRAIDDFDVNIVDLSARNMWTYYYDTVGRIDAHQDLATIQQMVANKRKAAVVYALPQNIPYTYDTRYTAVRQTHALKDVLNGVQKYSIKAVIPANMAMAQIAYEKTATSVLGQKIDADFYFTDPEKIITKSDKSEKPTTIEIGPRIYATTLAITKSMEEMKCFVAALFEQNKGAEIPVWAETIYFGDDAEQNAIISMCNAQIKEAEDRILVAQAKLKENAEIKSIVYTNGDQLVTVVFKILEKLLNCDLSGFTDKNKEDFLIKLPRCTFIGEIKGVTSNVKFEHISQLELHYRGYLDQLVESGTEENVKQLLIINPFRTKPLEQRDPVHTEQEKLAVRNGCLIIETYTLMRIFEKVCSGQITSHQCEEVFEKHTGLLRITDFEEPAEDLESFKA